MARFYTTDTGFDCLIQVSHPAISDRRGSLTRLFCKEELRELGFDSDIAQINLTHTAKAGTFRGFHYQVPPHSEIKMITCIRGEVQDIVIDLRAGSATYLKHFSTVLSAENERSLIVPKGFAHGFQSLCDDCEMLYFHSAMHEPSSEAGVNYKDPRLSIQLPLEISCVSERDLSFALIDSNFRGISL